MKKRVLKQIGVMVVVSIVMLSASACDGVVDLIPISSNSSYEEPIIVTPLKHIAEEYEGNIEVIEEEPEPEDLTLSGAEIATLSRSVLTVYVYDNNRVQISSGSGFIAFNDRTLVTNYHVINNGIHVEAVSEEDVIFIVSGILYMDEEADIAVLQLENTSDLPVLDIGDSALVQAGDIVYAIGSPFELTNTVSNGIISAIRNPSMFREVSNVSDFQTTASISPGSSGGALLNEFGEVIGMTTAQLIGGQNLNFAIPSSEFAELNNFDSVAVFADVFTPPPPPPNVFESYNINTGVNQVTFTPKKVWYEDGKLYVEMFIHNGLRTTAFNLREVWLEFSNEDGLIAEGSFGALQNASIGAGQHIVWTFIFGGDCVHADDAVLNGYLYNRFSVRYSH
jgi:SLAP domain-containing protein